MIAIIGGGFCGTLTAVHLLRRAAPGTRIVLIERSGDFGPGVAYATRDDRHLLNVPAARMSAFGDEPDDFSEWACGGDGASWASRSATTDDAAPLLLIGSGLTAVDVALAHCARSPRARVVAVSRHGRLPFAHLPGLRCPAPAPALPGGRLRLDALERSIRAHVARMEADGYDWRDALDGLRPHVPAFWGRLPLLDRRRFLRERARAWEVRRHRMAPVVAAEIAGLRAAGRLELIAGAVAELRARRRGVELRLCDGRALRGAATVACAGPGADVTATPGPLLRGLLAGGHAQADPLRLGLRATSGGALVDAAGRSDGRVWVLGPLRRGELWESTAVPELREQAATVARALIASLAGRHALTA